MLSPRDSDPLDEDDEIPSGDPQPIQGPAEFIRAAEMQRSYWTPNAQALAQLESQNVDQLGWRDLLRLHHLICLQQLVPGGEREATLQKCRRTVRRLLSAESPYLPRPALIWQRRSEHAGGERDPDMLGILLNPSLTYLGCLEFYRMDAANAPTRIDFLSFDELAGVVFGPPNLLRAAKLFYKDGRNETVFVPLLYGLTWWIGSDYDRAGRMTRFVSHLDGVDAVPTWASGIGVGHQDLSIQTHNGESSLFGLGSVDEIVFA